MSHQVECPYKNSHIRHLPCRFVQHPHNANIYYCSNCGGNEYDIRDIGNTSPEWLIFAVGILVLFIMVKGIVSQPPTVPTNANPIQIDVNESEN